MIQVTAGFGRKEWDWRMRSRREPSFRSDDEDMTQTFPKEKLEQALLDPTSVFKTPDEVAAQTGLTVEQRTDILRRWGYDSLDLEVAEEENMGGGEPDLLDQIVKALESLGVEPNLRDRPPTKQGSI
jgi:hypothetical protein